MWVLLGSMFSFIEALSLVLLIIEAIQQHRLIRHHETFHYGSPICTSSMYIIGAAFWNFVGPGVFGGGTLNAPLINYYEHGTFLTLNHAHTTLFGAFRLLAIGLIYFCLRYATADEAAFRRAARLLGFLALQWRSCTLGIPDRMAATRRCLRARSCLHAQCAFYNKTSLVDGGVRSTGPTSCCHLSLVNDRRRPVRPAGAPTPAARCGSLFNPRRKPQPGRPAPRQKAIGRECYEAGRTPPCPPGPL